MEKMEKKYKLGNYVVVVSNSNERVGQVVVVNDNATYTIQYNDSSYGYKIDEKYIHLPSFNDVKGYSLRSKVINTNNNTSINTATTTTNVDDINTTISNIDDIDDIDDNTTTTNVNDIDSNNITNIDDINTKKCLKEATSTSIIMNMNVDTFKNGIVTLLSVLMYTIVVVVVLLLAMLAVVYVNFF